MNRHAHAERERRVVRREDDLAAEADDVHVGHEELIVLHGDGRRLAVVQRQLGRLHDVRAAVALGGLHEHEHLDVAQEGQAHRDAAVGAQRAGEAAERGQREGA